MLTAADGTAFTGAVTVAVTIDNGTQTTGSVGSGACTHEGNGYHTYAPAQAETNGDLVAFTFTGTGASPVTVQVFTDATYDRIGSTGSGLTSLASASALTTVDNEIAALQTTADAILVDTAEIGAAGAGLTAVPWNASWDAEVQSEVQDAIEANNLDHLMAVAATGATVADDSVIAQLVSSAATADWDTFDNTTDAMQALRDRGDVAWTTGGGGSITDILQWDFLIPTAIDLANTASWQLGLMVTNQVDDLPSTAEITPGTISIDRKAQGATTWSAVVTDAACSEIAGLIYYDEVFDTASGYSAGDSLRITFKDQVVTVSANVYELTGATGRILYTNIITSTPAVNLTQINGSTSNVAALNSFFGTLNGSGQLQAGSLASDTITAVKIADGALTGDKQGTGWVTNIQSGLATAAALTTVDNEIAALQGDVTSILTDTGTTIPALIATVQADTDNIQTRLPTALTAGGMIQASIEEINAVALVGDGAGTPFTI